jgi:probable metal-binding protein
MSTIAHAHDVLDILSRAEATADELRSKVSESWGAQARFTNCRGDIFDFDQLLAFLQANGKVTARDGRFSVARDNGCSH